MLIFSLKLSEKAKKNFFIFFSLFIFAAVMVICLLLFGSRDYTAEVGDKTYQTTVRSESDLQKFAGQFDVKITDKPVKTEKVLIPLNFNDIYMNYNNIQKEIGLNLEPYKGKKCIKYTFDVQNPKDEIPVQLNVLVYCDKVIGADLSEKSYNGFIKSLAR